jgi:hypothetical protein
MEKKNNEAATNASNNNNSNNVNVNVNVSHPRRSYNRKKKSAWLMKAIVGGIVTLLVSLASYYITSNTEADSKNPTKISPGKLEEASAHN